MNAAQPLPSFDALLKFMGHVAQCYPEVGCDGGVET